MDLLQIGVFALGGVLYATVLPARWRGWTLLIGSVLAVYWLQPRLNIRQLDFWLPTATLLLAIGGWWWTREAALTPGPAPKGRGEKDSPLDREQATVGNRDNAVTLAVVVGLVLVVSATRYLVPELRLTSRPPDTLLVALALLLSAGIGWTVWRLVRGINLALGVGMLLIVALFAITKAEPVARWLAGYLRAGQGQDIALASAVDIGWLGFSYVAFRLIHTLRDRQTGALPDLSLREYLTYVIFFPAYTAGPIDRAERFTPEYRALPQTAILSAPRWEQAGRRIVSGLGKKFVIADSLALIALNASSAEQALNAGGLWLLLYAYAFQLFFDFSGYSDIAIGLGILFGIKLPENFNAPYLKNNIARFWQSWHITLSNWARFYVFSPLSRWLLRRDRKPPQYVIILSSHVATMSVIGLWHGITLTFFVWGLWHAAGLFAHKVWSDRTRKWYISLKDKPRTKRAWTIIGVLLTFHFVVLSWVWFALPDFGLALTTFGRLFGLGW